MIIKVWFTLIRHFQKTISEDNNGDFRKRYNRVKLENCAEFFTVHEQNFVLLGTVYALHSMFTMGLAIPLGHISYFTCHYFQFLFFDVVVLFHLLAIADKIYGNHCAPWSVEIFIKYAFPSKWGAMLRSYGPWVWTNAFKG